MRLIVFLALAFSLTYGSQPDCEQLLWQAYNSAEKAVGTSEFNREYALRAISELNSAKDYGCPMDLQDYELIKILKELTR